MVSMTPRQGQAKVSLLRATSSWVWLSRITRRCASGRSYSDQRRAGSPALGPAQCPAYPHVPPTLGWQQHLSGPWSWGLSASFLELICKKCHPHIGNLNHHPFDVVKKKEGLNKVSQKAAFLRRKARSIWTRPAEARRSLVHGRRVKAK